MYLDFCKRLVAAVGGCALAGVCATLSIVAISTLLLPVAIPGYTFLIDKTFHQAGDLFSYAGDNDPEDYKVNAALQVGSDFAQFCVGLGAVTTGVALIGANLFLGAVLASYTATAVGGLWAAGSAIGGAVGGMTGGAATVAWDAVVASSVAASLIYPQTRNILLAPINLALSMFSYIAEMHERGSVFRP